MRAGYIFKSVMVLALSAALCSTAWCEEKNHDQTVDELRDTLAGVLQALVEKGLLTREQAQAIVAQAQAKAQADAQARAQEKAAQDEKEKDAIRVTYVPQIVRDEISKQVAKDVTPTVTNNVLEQAQKEKWGVPGALPDWISRFRFSGDLRFRMENDHFASDNQPQTYLNYNNVNSAGGISKAGIGAYLNTTQDRFYQQVRLHLGIDAHIADGVSAGVRLATGSLTNPVTTNQTLGQSDNHYQFAIDQAYLRYDLASHTSLPWMSTWLGRIPNPFVSTDLVWYSDLQFEGIASTWRYILGSDKTLPTHVFLTGGAFPLQTTDLSSRNKWLYAGQTGVVLPWSNEGKFTFAAAYYSYSHIAGIQNQPGLTLLNYTAPQFMQKGNTVFDILNDTDPTTNLYALAADFHELDITASVNIPAQNHLVTVTADYVDNLGYKQSAVLQRAGYSSLSDVPNDQGQQLAFDKMTTGYLARVAFGSITTGTRGTWRTSIEYRYLQRDAVLDAFTDSEFHLGGTNAKGYMLKTDWWFLNHSWLSLRYINSDEIKHTGQPYQNSLNQTVVPSDSPRFGVDQFMFDVNGQF